MRIFLNALLVVAIVIGAYLLTRDGVKESRGIFSKQQLETFTSIKISRNNEDFSIRRMAKEEGLTLFYPKTEILYTDKENIWAIDSDNLNRLVYTLALLEKRNSAEEKSEFGLESPEYIISVFSPAGDTELRLGKEHPFSGRRYAKLASGESFLIDEALIAGTLDLDFRFRKILKFDPKKILGILIIESGTDALALALRGSEWFSGTEEEPLDSERVLRFFNKLSELEFDSSLAAVDPGFQAKKSFDLQLALEDRTASFSIDVDSARVGVLSLPGTTRRFALKATRLFFTKPDELRSRRLFGKLEPAAEFEALREVEVLTVEKLPGRFFSAKQPRCEFVSTDKRFRFAVLEEIEGSGNGDTPSSYAADVGALHFGGSVSSAVANRFCGRVAK